MKPEYYQKVAYIGLLNPDGSMTFYVPLYVKVSEVNKNGIAYTQEEKIRQISEIMNCRYEKQISEYMAGFKKQSEVNGNENDISG